MDLGALSADVESLCLLAIALRVCKQALGLRVCRQALVRRDGDGLHALLEKAAPQS